MKKVVLATVALSIGICGSPAQAVDSGDLSSSERTLNAGAAGTFGTATLNAKTDHERTVSATDFVTPAELVALSQVLNTQAQSIILDGAGRAVGGTAMLHTDFAAGHPTALTIPQGVVLVHDQSIAGNLSITGNLINAGAIYSVASSLSNTSATIQANSIFNAQTGVISSVLPSILAGNYASSVNLNLVSVGDVTNLGAITSSGALSITAGGAVQNLATGTILANASANIMSLAGNIVNSGSILAQAGNIALSSLSTQNLLINNTLGSITALTGAVNIGTEGCIEKINTAILGGDIVARQLNVHSGDGSVVLNLNRTTATVNITAGEAHVFTAAGDLSLGLLNLSGDPTFYNQGGDILINTDLVFPGQPLAVVAARDIRTSTGAGRISTASFGGGGDIVFIAGAAFEADGPSVTSNPFAPVELRITGPSATGGIINLAGATPITEFDSSSSGGAGGNINLIAFRGALAGGGSITTPANVTIKSGGAPGKSNGDVTLLASAYPTAISIGSIDTSGGNSGGNVVLAACSFINYNHPVVKDSRLAPGTIYIYEDPFGGYSFSGSIYAASIGTGGGNISLLAGEDMHVNSVNLNGTSTRSRHLKRHWDIPIRIRHSALQVQLVSTRLLPPGVIREAMAES